MSASPGSLKQFHGLVERSYPRGGHLYTAGEPAQHLFVIRRGAVHLVRLTEEGQRLITDVLGPGQVCGEEALRPDGVYQASAVTLQPTSVTLVSHQTLHQLVLVHPDLVVTLLARLEERLERASERLVEVASQRVPSRVAAALLRQMAGCACPVLQLTHQDIADMVGTQREVVTRLLDHLRSRGAIRLGRGRVEVLNAELLAALRKEPF